jgi:hypothetical protein
LVGHRFDLGRQPGLAGLDLTGARRLAQAALTRAIHLKYLTALVT